MGWVDPSATATPTSKGKWVDAPATESAGFHVRMPAQVGSNIANSVVNFLTPPDPREHPVEFGLYGLQSALPFLSDIPGLGLLAKGGLPGALTRLGATTGLGTGVAAATGQPLAPAAKESAEVGTAGELMSAVGGKILRSATGLGKAEGAATNAMREPQADELAKTALQNQLGVTSGEASQLARPQMETSLPVYGMPETVGKKGVPASIGTLPERVIMAPSESEANQLIPSRETIPGSHDLRTAQKSIYQARESARRAIGRQYDPIYGPIEQQTVPSTDLAKIAGASTEQRGWLAGKNAQIKPANEKIFAGLSAYQNTVDMIHAEGRHGFIDPMGIPRPSPTIGQLRGELTNLMAQANSPSTSNLERQALMKASQPILEALDKPIRGEDRPLLAQINEDYAQISRIFPFRDLKAISQARTLPDLGEAVFGKGHEATTSMALSRMSEPQKQLMRRAWGSYLLKDGASPTETISKLQKNKAGVEQLYAGTDFGKIETWRQMMIAQQKIAKNKIPMGLPSQQQFENQLKQTIQESGLTPEALQAANEVLHKSGGLAPGKMVPHGLGRYMVLTAPLMGVMGWGPYHHEPGLGALAAGYYGGMLGWRWVADNPVRLDLYRRFIMNPISREGADAFGRLFVAAVNDTHRATAHPEQQAVGHMKDMSEGKEALDTSRAEAIAPTPSASEKAEKVGQKLEENKKPPDIHQDLNRGRLSHTEVDSMLQYASSKDASKVVSQPIPLSEVIDALEQASPEELQMLLPLVQKRLQQELPKEKNMTRVANISKRFQAVQQKANQPQQSPQEQAEA